MQLIHVLSADSVDSVLHDGLRYGSKGIRSHGNRAQETDNYLDAQVLPADEDLGY